MFNLYFKRLMFQQAYLTYIIRIKFIIHLFTGKCEIERAGLANNHEQLDYSILHSKTLITIRNQLNEQFFTQQYATMIIHAKNIRNQRNKFHVVKTLRELYALKDTIKLIKEARAIKYSREDKEHERKLLQIWKNLKNSDIEERITQKWISIGFQGSDPATDFRGAGSLGLNNLYEFSYTKQCKQAFEIANNPKTQYFFCSAGLFLTMLCQELIKLKMYGYTFWVENNDQKMKKFQKIYNFLFWKFHEFWLQCQDKTMMSFNVNLNKFALMVKRIDPKKLQEDTFRFIQQNDRIF